MKAKPKPGDVIYVRWVDSCGVTGWCHKDDHDGTMKKMETSIKSIGFLVMESEQGIMLSAHRYENTEYDDSHGPLAIPKRAILEWGFLSKEKS